jgi:hypothetical protein
MKPQDSPRRRNRKSNTAGQTPPNAGSNPGEPEVKPSQKKPRVQKPAIINVAELSQAETDNAWNDSLYVSPTDDDAFIRAQKVTIAYCTFYAPTMDAEEYTLEEAYDEARKIARPIAALGAGIALTLGQMSEYAFEIHDSIASWADAEDDAVQVIRTIFEAYSSPRGNYRQVKAVKPKSSAM